MLIPFSWYQMKSLRTSKTNTKSHGKSGSPSHKPLESRKALWRYHKPIHKNPTVSVQKFISTICPKSCFFSFLGKEEVQINHKFLYIRTYANPPYYSLISSQRCIPLALINAFWDHFAATISNPIEMGFQYVFCLCRPIESLESPWKLISSPPMLSRKKYLYKYMSSCVCICIYCRQ